MKEGKGLFIEKSSPFTLRSSISLEILFGFKLGLNLSRLDLRVGFNWRVGFNLRVDFDLRAEVHLRDAFNLRINFDLRVGLDFRVDSDLKDLNLGLDLIVDNQA